MEITVLLQSHQQVERTGAFLDANTLPRVNRGRTAVRERGGIKGQVGFVSGTQGVGSLHPIRSTGRDRLTCAADLLDCDIVTRSELRVSQFVWDRVGEVPGEHVSWAWLCKRTGHGDGS